MEVRQIPPAGSLRYQEFLRSSHLSIGVYRLEAGAEDLQRPHAEDELYYVMSGRARFTSRDRTIDVQPGACLLVPAHEPHRFHDIAEPLDVLVVFGPAEGTRRE